MYKAIMENVNSQNELYNKIVTYSMQNTNSASGEKVRYFMYKYNLTLDDWKNVKYILTAFIRTLICI